MRDVDLRIMQVPEDAADGCVVIVPRPPKSWACDRCFTRNNAHDLNCQYCAEWRPDVCGED